MSVSSASIFEIVVEGVADGQAVNNVFHYGTIDGVSLDDPWTPAEFLDAFIGMWRDNILSVISNSYFVRRYTLKEFTEAVNTPVYANFFKYGEKLSTDVDPVSNSGAVIGAALPTYAATTIRKITGKVGKHQRGSTRLGPVPEVDTSATSQNALTDAAYEAWTTASNELFNPISVTHSATSKSLIQYVFHKRWAFKNRSTLLPATPRQLSDKVVNWVVNRYLGSQVSRKRRNTGV